MLSWKNHGLCPKCLGMDLTMHFQWFNIPTHHSGNSQDSLKVLQGKVASTPSKETSAWYCSSGVGIILQYKQSLLNKAEARTASDSHVFTKLISFTTDLWLCVYSHCNLEPSAMTCGLWKVGQTCQPTMMLLQWFHMEPYLCFLGNQNLLIAIWQFSSD